MNKHRLHAAAYMTYRMHCDFSFLLLSNKGVIAVMQLAVILSLLMNWQITDTRSHITIIDS